MWVCLHLYIMQLFIARGAPRHYNKLLHIRVEFS